MAAFNPNPWLLMGSPLHTAKALRHLGKATPPPLVDSPSFVDHQVHSASMLECALNSIEFLNLYPVVVSSPISLVEGTPLRAQGQLSTVLLNHSNFRSLGPCSGEGTTILVNFLLFCVWLVGLVQ